MAVSHLLKQAILEAVKATENAEKERLMYEDAGQRFKAAQQKLRIANDVLVQQARKDFPKVGGSTGMAGEDPEKLLLIDGKAYLLYVLGAPSDVCVKVYTPETSA